jgi:hypothetical protein
MVAAVLILSISTIEVEITGVEPGFFSALEALVKLV